MKASKASKASQASKASNASKAINESKATRVRPLHHISTALHPMDWMPMASYGLDPLVVKLSKSGAEGAPGLS